MSEATKNRRLHLTDRDWEVLTILDCHPLTAQQILLVSASFEAPFTRLRLTQRRLHRLAANGYLRSWPYATTGSSPHYYKLTRTAYRLLHGDDAVLPGRRYFEEIALNHHLHTRALGDFLVHLIVSAHRHSVTVRQFSRENSLRIEVDGDTLYPDCAFQLAAPGGKTFNYVVELDNGTERIRSTKATESLERKIRGYDCHQSQYAVLDPRRYVVLFVTTRSSLRTEHILDAARSLMENPKRTVFLASELSALLSQPDPMIHPCLRDNRGRKRGVLPSGTCSTKPRRSEVSVAAMAC